MGWTHIACAAAGVLIGSLLTTAWRKRMPHRRRERDFTAPVRLADGRWFPKVDGPPPPPPPPLPQIAVSDDEQLPVGGGPLDGQTRPWRCTQRLVVPDRAGSRMVASGDGLVTTIYPEHTYELASYDAGGAVAYLWQYVGKSEVAVTKGHSEGKPTGNIGGSPQ